MYARQMVAGWSDMDFNAHMRNTAFLDKAADVRMMFFADHGFPISEFVRLRLGPVVTKDEVEYFREVGLLQQIRVNIAVAGLSVDGSRFRIRNEIRSEADKVCATVTSTGGWFDLDARKIVAPPEALRAALLALPRTDDYAPIRSTLTRGR